MSVIIEFVKIKAIIFDLDGTAIPNRIDGTPSKRVIDAVKKAQQKGIKVSIATGRPLAKVRGIIQALGIESPCIIAAGTQIIDPVTEETLWKQELSLDQVKQIIEIAKPYSFDVWTSDGSDPSPAKERQVKQEQVMFLLGVPKEDTADIMSKLKKIPQLIAHEVNSWTQGHYDIHLTHVKATKKHALEELLKIEKIDKEHIMAAGDGNNDLPLFEMAAYKVAMGNAMQGLKDKADYITDSVENDGLAKAIEEKLFV